MCGIFGIVYRDQERTPDREAVERARDLLRHRGPDEAGTFLAPGIGLGHRRLRIIDLSSGKQPLTNEDGSVVVVFNGEIYNFLELRKSLEAKGHRFATNSDTETIVHLYEEVGSDFATHLDGMFAIALWDRRDRALWLARDRLGKKPLFYYEDSEKLVFGSELKAILTYPGVRVHLEETALVDYLHLGYIPAPRTVFREIKKLLPGHVACWKEGLLKSHSYWQLPTPGTRDWNWEDACEAFRQTFEKAVRRRLISDVPLGAFLSGGLDSSAVVAVMSKVASRPVRTFTIAFDERSHDESADARQVAKHLGTDHLELRAEPWGLELLPKIVWYMDEPMADSSALPTYLVSHLAREHVTVALSGDGGDELLGGYTRYFPDRRDRRFLRLPAVVRRRMGRIARHFPEWVPARRYFQYIGRDALARYFTRVGIGDSEVVTSLVTPEVLEAGTRHNPLDQMRAADLLPLGDESIARFTYLDYQNYLPNDILVKVDRMSMASALEVRAPFLDHHLVELVFSFPEEFRATRGETKRVLRAMVEPLLPPGALQKQKHGFSVPIGSWFRNGTSNYVEDVLFDSRTRSRGLWREETVRKLLARQRSGRTDHSPILWALLCFELWYRQFVDSAVLS